jgi:hypothetical protein
MRLFDLNVVATKTPCDMTPPDEPRPADVAHLDESPREHYLNDSGFLSVFLHV